MKKTSKLKSETYRRHIQQCSKCTKSIVLHAFSTYTCEECKINESHPNLSFPRLCLKCAQTKDQCRWCLKKMD